MRVTLQVYREEQPVSAFDLEGEGALVLGRAPDRSLCTLDAAAGKHAVLRLDEGRLFLEDAGLLHGARLMRSTGGAWIGVDPESRLEIRHGDSLEAFEHVLRCTFSPPPDLQPPPSSAEASPLETGLPIPSQQVFDPSIDKTRRLPVWWRPATPDGKPPPAPASAVAAEEQEPPSAAPATPLPEDDDDPTLRDLQRLSPISGFEVLTPKPEEKLDLDSGQIQQQMPVRLIVLDGEQPRSQTFEGPVLKVGRDRKQDLRLHDPSVSARHVEIMRAGSGYFIRDLGSRNGTRVDGRRLGKGVDVPLFNNSVVAFGDAWGVFICDAYARGVTANWDVGRHNTLLGRLFDLGGIEPEQAQEVERAMQRTHAKLVESLVLKGQMHPRRWLELKRKMPEYGLDEDAELAERAARKGGAGGALWIGLLIALMLGGGLVILLWGPGW